MTTNKKTRLNTLGRTIFLKKSVSIKNSRNWPRFTLDWNFVRLKWHFDLKCSFGNFLFFFRPYFSWILGSGDWGGPQNKFYYFRELNARSVVRKTKLVFWENCKLFQSVIKYAWQCKKRSHVTKYVPVFQKPNRMYLQCGFVSSKALVRKSFRLKI